MFFVFALENFFNLLTMCWGGHLDRTHQNSLQFKMGRNNRIWRYSRTHRRSLRYKRLDEETWSELVRRWQRCRHYVTTKSPNLIPAQAGLDQLRHGRLERSCYLCFPSPDFNPWRLVVVIRSLWFNRTVQSLQNTVASKGVGSLDILSEDARPSSRVQNAPFVDEYPSKPMMCSNLRVTVELPMPLMPILSSKSLCMYCILLAWSWWLLGVAIYILLFNGLY